MKLDCDGAKDGADSAIVGKEVQARCCYALRSGDIHGKAIEAGELSSYESVLRQVNEISNAIGSWSLDLLEDVECCLRIFVSQSIEDAEL